MRKQTTPIASWMGVCLFVLFSPVAAAVSLDTARVSPDISVTLSGQLLADENVGEDTLGGTLSLISLGSIPTNAGLSSYHLTASGEHLFTLDITVSLAGGITARPQDVIRYDDGLYSLKFTGSGFGIPPGALIDALSLNAAGDLLLSFDISLNLNGNLVADEDLVAFDGVNFSLFFDGSAAGIDPALDLDAAHFLADEQLLILSFDGSGVASATAISDEDLVQYDTVSLAWTMAYDGSVLHSEWVAADLDAAYITLLGELIFMDGFESP